MGADGGAGTGGAGEAVLGLPRQVSNMLVPINPLFRQFSAPAAVRLFHSTSIDTPAGT